MSIPHQCFICGKILYSMQQIPGKVMCNECKEKEERRIKEAEEKPAWDGVITSMTKDIDYTKLQADLQKEGHSISCAAAQVYWGKKCGCGKCQTLSQILISEKCDEIKELLLQKNKEYGDSAINPKRIFSTSDNVEQINVRIDDKLSRLMNSDLKVIQEDTELDLIGYLILRRVVKAYNTQQAEAKQ